MGYLDKYDALKKKQQEEERNKKLKNNNTYKNASSGSYLTEYERLKAQMQEKEKEEEKEKEDIAPVLSTRNTGGSSFDGEKKERKWFDTSVFDDGFQWSDIPKAVVGTSTDVKKNLWSGILGIGEKIVDAGMMVGTAMNQGSMMQAAQTEMMVGALSGKNTDGKAILSRYQQAQDEAEEATAKFVAKDLYDEEKIARKIISDPIKKLTGIDSEKDSLLGAKSDSLVQSGGQLIAQLGANAIAPGSGMALMAATAFGSEAEGAFKNDATFDEALLSATISAGAEILTEKIGGISFGGKTLTDAAFEGLSRKMTSKIAKVLITSGKVAADMTAEGAEEILSGYMSAIGQKLTYMEDKEIEELFSKEDMLESFIGGAVLGGAGSIGGVVQAKSKGVDYVTGLTKNEQAVAQKVYETELAKKEEKGKVSSREKNKLYNSVVKDMELGRIDTDTIESVLGGESYKSYQSMVEQETALNEQSKSITDEINTLLDKENPTMRDSERLAEARKELEQVKSNLGSLDTKTAKANLFSEVDKLTANDTKLRESYNEKARRGQSFEADLTKYDAKQQETIKGAIESGVLNNTNRSHDLVDFAAKIHKDTNIPIKFGNTKKIKEAGLYPKHKVNLQADGNTTVFDLGVKNLDKNFKPVVKVGDADVSNYKVDFENGKITFDSAPNGSVSVVVEGTEIVDAVYSKDGIILNVQSPKYLETLTGHEVFHAIKNAKLDGKLNKVLKEISEARGDYQTRLKNKQDKYNGIKNANIEEEVSANLLGEYIFEGRDFVMELATKDRNIFQKVYDEIKYLLKIATAGSKEARKLAEAEKEFAKVYRELAKAQNGGDAKYSLENNGKSKYNKHSKYSETETLFLSWENGSSPVGEVKKFARFGKTRYYQKTENGSVELSKQQYIERNREYAENTYGRAEREISEAFNHDEITQRGLHGDYNSNRNTDGNATVFGQTLREELSGVTGGSASGTLRNDRGNSGINQTEYNDEASDDSGASFATFSNDYATIRNFMKEGDAGEQSGATDSDSEIRFSLSESVEQTKDLVAVHNLNSSELIETLKLSGLPSPSVAIIKAKDGHEKYGDVSLILPKEAIDPQANKANRIYGSDAWTPTRSNAQVEYEVDYDTQRQFERTIESLSKDVANGVFSKSSVLGMAGIEDSTGLNLDEILKKVSDYDAVQAAYVAENGGNVEVVYRTKEFDSYGNDALKGYIDKVGEQEVARLTAKMMTGERLTAAEIETAKDSIVDNWVAKRDYALRQKPELRDGRIAKFRDRLTDLRVEDFISHSWEFYEGDGTTTDEIDRSATGDNLRSAVNRTDVESWVAEKLQGLLSEPAIYNGLDPYTPSGRIRSFKETHWDYTAENIVRAMNNADARGANVWNVSGEAIIATATSEYKNIDEVRADKDRLFKADDEYYEQIKDDISSELQAVTKDIIRTTDHHSDNQYDEEQIIGRVIMEAAQSTKTIAGVKRVFQKNGYRIADAQAKSVLSLFDHASSVPTGYFEAKPQRVVDFGEVGVYVIPRNADVKLKQELLNRGYTIAEYDPDIEGDRQKVVNRFEEYQFSLSDTSDLPKQSGYRKTLGKDIALETAPETTEAVEADIAPTPATISKTETVEDYAPGESLEEQLAKADESVESLDTETESLFRDLSDQKITEAEFAEKWQDLDKRYTQARQDQERLSAEMTDINNRKYESLDDSDIPPEAEAPYYGDAESVAPVDPFAERDMNDVGKRNVKAYMHENPEVKPFFQDAARGMLFDLQNGTKGERIFNEQMHYESGYEQGWMGTKRRTTGDIADLLDQWGYTYAQIEDGLNAIIEGGGKENNAVSKRIEFMLDNRLRNGYKDVEGRPIPADEGYINLLKEKQIDDYRRESFDSFMEVADQYAPPVEDIAPVKDVAPLEIEPAIEGEQNVLDGFEKEKEPERLTRAKLHGQIVDGIKAEFAKKGLDLDEVLKNAKRMNALSINDNTPQRVNDKTFGYEAGEALNELTFNRVALRESNGTKWLNKQVDTIRNLSKKYKIKPLSKESAAAQMYAEGFWVNEKDEIIAYGDAELAKDFPDVRVQNRIKALASDPTIRKIYDDTLSAINESRTRNAYPEIPRLENYYLHFRAMDDTFSRLGVPFNPNDIKAKDLPTDINGTTIDRKPGQPYFASSMHRMGKRTSFDLFGGLEKYLNSAKNQIYHIDDIQTTRALWGYIADRFGQAHGLENLDQMEYEAQAEHIQQVYDGHLSNYARFLVEYANNLAGKTALIDRGVEGLIGRRALQFINTVNMQTSRNQVGYSISSPLTNFIPSMEAIARTSKRDSIKAFAQTVSNVFRKDGFVENDLTLIRRRGTDKFAKTLWDKMSDPGFILMQTVDNVTSEFIVRTKYNELTRKGMDSAQAHVKAGEWASRIMGDRSLGQMPLHYNSKFMGLFTKYQLEVRNALDSQFYDTFQEAKASTKEIENQKAKNALTATKFAYRAVQIAALNHVFGMAFEKIAGYNPAFDIISTIATLFGWDDDEEDEDTFGDNAEQAFKELLGDLPYTSLFTENGRIPIGSAMPIKQLVSGVDKYGNEKSRLETLAEAAPYYLLPGGYGQIKKTTQGLGMFSEEHPVSGSYTDSGNLRFPVEKTFGNVLQAGVFGQYASENARDYFDNERKPLKEKQIQEFIDVDIPIKDYWDYREGLAELKTNEEKVDYIDSLDLPLSKKNILVNNVLDRKEDVDLEDYGEYGSLAEFDFAVKYPEKYQFLEENGVTYEAYSTADEDTKDAYNWAFQNPEKFAVSKAIADDVVEYKSYTKGLGEIEADKDENGKSINGSRKEKVFAYIESLPLDYGQKCILFKSQYKADDSMNMDIIEYLDSREDIDYEAMVTILKELDFTVEGDNIYWD